MAENLLYSVGGGKVKQATNGSTHFVRYNTDTGQLEVSGFVLDSVNGVLFASGGSVSSEAQVALSRGGTNANNSGAGCAPGHLLVGNAGSTAYEGKSVSGDASMAATGALTVTGLQGSPVSATAPSTGGQVLTWNGAAWVAAASQGSGSGGGGTVYYMNFGTTTGISPTTGLPTNSGSTPTAPPSLLGRDYVVGTTTLTSQNLTDGSYVFIAGFVTVPTDPGVTNIPAGLWDFNIWASVDSGNALQTQFQVRVYKYNSSGGGTYVLLGSSDDVYIYDPTVVAQYIANVTIPQTTITTADRIYVELWGQKNTSASRTITFSFDSTTPSHVHTTIPSVAGTGIVHVVDGVFQSPASNITDSDVDDVGASKITGTLGVGHGGTGKSDVTDGALLLGAGGTAALTELVGTVNGQVATWRDGTWGAEAGGGGGSSAYTVETVTAVDVTGFSNGKIVAWDSTNVLVLADNSVESKTHIAGVIQSISVNDVTIFTSGTATLASVAGASRGTALYADSSGNVQQYSGITSGEYIVFLGYVSDATAKTITLNPNVRGTRA